jgi:type IX secretion system substrate protein
MFIDFIINRIIILLYYTERIFSIIFDVALKDKRMIKKILFIFFIVIASIAKQSQAQTPYVAIPDSNFVHYLKTIVPTAFKGDSLNKTSTLVTTITKTINVLSKSISSLNGVQYFTSLDSLICGSNPLTSLPSLPNSLTILNCETSLLTSLPTLPNSLIFLGLFNNSLTTLPLLPTSLQRLDCSYNSLTTLPSLPNSLVWLHCNNNSITCFPTFPNSITSCILNPNSYNCLPNYVLPAMNSYTTTPLCAAGNTNGCPIAVAGISQYSNLNTNISVYPNPASSIINVELKIQNEIQNTSLTITDMLGNTVQQSIIYNPQSIISVSNLAEGVYNLQISTSSNLQTNKRLVIVR